MNSQLTNILPPKCSIRILLYLFVLFTLSLSGCAHVSEDLPTAIYRGYAGPDIAADKLATLGMGKTDWVRIDNAFEVKRSEYGTIQLEPGLHRVKMAATFYGSVMRVPGGSIQMVSSSFSVPFEAGRTYKCQVARSYGIRIDYFFWIEDAKTGELIAGKKLPSWKEQ